MSALGCRGQHSWRKHPGRPEDVLSFDAQASQMGDAPRRPHPRPRHLGLDPFRGRLRYQGILRLLLSRSRWYELPFTRHTHRRLP